MALCLDDTIYQTRVIEFENDIDTHRYETSVGNFLKTIPERIIWWMRISQAQIQKKQYVSCCTDQAD